MSRLRWTMGGALALLAAGACAQAMGTYVQHQLWLGAGTVAVLALMDVAGFVSLWKARARLAREWTALSADVPGGALVEERRARLLRVREAGGLPNVDAMGMATAAQERQNAYLGRYVVAVTVLVGLVGTFAGLMETLRNVTPLLRNGTDNTFELLAAPLSGLDVTFGASLVAILVTVALTMVQGDLELAEEAMLARLDEVTQHVLVPQVWPARERPEERTLHEMAALRLELKDWATATSERTAGLVAGAARGELEGMVKAVDHLLRDAVSATAGQLKDHARDTARLLDDALKPAVETHTRGVEALAATMADKLGAAVDAVKDTGTRVATSVGEAAERGARGLADAQAQHVAALAAARKAEDEQHARTRDALAGAALEVTASMEKVEEALAASAAKQGEAASSSVRAVEGAARALVEAQERAQVEVTRALAEATRTATEESTRARELHRDTLQKALADLQEQAGGITRSLSEAAAAGAAESARARDLHRETLETALRDMQARAAEVAASARGDAERVAAALEAAVEALGHSATASREAHARALTEQSQALATQFHALADALSGAVNTVTSRLEATAGTQLEALAEGARQVQEAQKALVTTSDEHARRAADEMHAFIRALVEDHAKQLAAQARSLEDALNGTAVKFDDAVATAREALAETAGAAREGWSSLNESLRGGTEAVSASLGRVAEEHARTLGDTAGRVEEALKGGILQAGEELSRTVVGLSEAAQQLKAGVDAMQPLLAGLGPEMQALGREVALLASRTSDGTGEGAVLEEMTRLGDHLDRLQELVQASRGAQS